MSMPDEHSPGGSAIYRHAARERDWDPVSGDTSAIQAIERHIAQYFGSIDTVYHELASDLFHLDVHEVSISFQITESEKPSSDIQL